MIIKTMDATKTIHGTVILDGVNIELESGKIYGLQGPNGSGKTMLMRLLCGLIRPTSGAVYIDEKRLGEHMDFPNSVGLLLESPAFLPNYTGLKNLQLLAGIQKKASVEQIRKAITDVGLDPDDKRKYRKYSLGMKQRLGIAAAIMEEPDLLFFDEPTNALDDKGIIQICSLIKRERDRGALIVMACHDASVLEAMSDHIYTISEGKVEKKVSQ